MTAEAAPKPQNTLGVVALALVAGAIVAGLLVAYILAGPLLVAGTIVAIVALIQGRGQIFALVALGLVLLLIGREVWNSQYQLKLRDFKPAPGETNPFEGKPLPGN